MEIVLISNSEQWYFFESDQGIGVNNKEFSSASS